MVIHPMLASHAHVHLAQGLAAMGDLAGITELLRANSISPDALLTLESYLARG